MIDANTVTKTAQAVIDLATSVKNQDFQTTLKLTFGFLTVLITQIYKIYQSHKQHKEVMNTLSNGQNQNTTNNWSHRIMEVRSSNRDYS